MPGSPCEDLSRWFPIRIEIDQHCLVVSKGRMDVILAEESSDSMRSLASVNQVSNGNEKVHPRIETDGPHSFQHQVECAMNIADAEHPATCDKRDPLNVMTGAHSAKPQGCLRRFRCFVSEADVERDGAIGFAVG